MCIYAHGFRLVRFPKILWGLSHIPECGLDALIPNGFVVQASVSVLQIRNNLPTLFITSCNYGGKSENTQGHQMSEITSFESLEEGKVQNHLLLGLRFRFTEIANKGLISF